MDSVEFPVPDDVPTDEVPDEGDVDVAPDVRDETGDPAPAGDDAAVRVVADADVPGRARLT